MKEIARIECSKEILDLAQAKFEDYRAKQDLLTALFEIHKYDDDDLVIKSLPFKSYEKQFMEAKVEYDQVMKMIQDTIIPEEYKQNGYRFELDFEQDNIKIEK